MLRHCMLFGLAVTLGVSAYIAADLQYLLRYKTVILADYWGWIAFAAGLLFANVTTLAFIALRSFGMSSTGRKLEHMDRGLRGDNPVMQELSDRLANQ